MTIVEMKRIVNAYMRVLATLARSPRLLTRHLYLTHPESLLPYNKVTIQQALIKAISLARHRQDKLQMRDLERGLICLQSFVEDEYAARHNRTILSSRFDWDNQQFLDEIEQLPKAG